MTGSAAGVEVHAALPFSSLPVEDELEILVLFMLLRLLAKLPIH
jgi:hypothetical protein